MTIKFSSPNNQRTVRYQDLNHGRVFKLVGDSAYYMKIPAVTHCGCTCNRIELSSGQPMRALDGSDFVIPVTLEAKEVNA